MHRIGFWLIPSSVVVVARTPLLLEKFTVFSALCFCFSCCLLLLYGVLLLVLDDEKLLFVEIQLSQVNQG